MTEEDKQSEKPKLTESDMLSIFHILLTYAGGNVDIPVEVLENYPKVEFRASYDNVNKRWHIFIPKKRIRGKIAVPKRQLIVPSQF